MAKLSMSPLTTLARKNGLYDTGLGEAMWLDLPGNDLSREVLISPNKVPEAPSYMLNIEKLVQKDKRFECDRTPWALICNGAFGLYVRRVK